MKSLGLDIGSNSVGSAWVDTDDDVVRVGVSVFPAGVDEAEEKRGAPKNQDRRGKRSLRRSLRRRSRRKQLLRQLLTKHGLLPRDADELKGLFAQDPWKLRRDGLDQSLLPYELGRVLLHLSQRRGAMGLNLPDSDESDDDENAAAEDAKVIGAVEHTRAEMLRCKARTFGEFVAIISEDERRHPVKDNKGNPKHDKEGKVVTYAEFPIRNRLDSFEFHADRTMIRDEFSALWDAQRSFAGPLAAILTDELRLALDNPDGDDTWRHKGLLFGQRRTYWDTGTLGRCDLEPTDRCIPVADRHASYFRVIESVNNLKIRGPRDRDFRALDEEQRAAVIDRLRRQKTGSIATIRKALRIDKQSLKKQDLSERDFALNVERDEQREINTDWFHRAIVLEAIGEEIWNRWDDARQEELNLAILRFDPQIDDNALRLRELVRKSQLDEDKVDQLVSAWRSRPKLERRLKLSRRAILNLLPYMNKFDAVKGRWATQIEARQMFAEDDNAIDQTSGKAATAQQRARYRLGGSRLTKDERYFMRKHPDLLPPAPTMSNPVVRKAIHEVRRHVIAHIRASGERPERIVIEFARETSKPAKISDQILFRNRNRERIRKQITDEVVRPVYGAKFDWLSNNQLRAAVERVILCVQQRGVCAYSSDALKTDDEGACAYTGRPITLRQAALGNGLEIDHIIPYSRCGDNSLNNRVLCYREANRDKTNKTPRDWWGDRFDDCVTPMRFMDGYQPEKQDYFRKRDYAAKWRNLNRTDVPNEWKGSQLSDTAYAAREVQTYLHQALWPDEPTHLAGANRRIYVTKGAYTSILRKDWQLYHKLLRRDATRDEVRRASAKNRGDHREHAVDAVAIALTDPQRILDLADHAKKLEDERVKARGAGRQPQEVKRKPLDPPWGTVRCFRRQVLSQLYDEIDPLDDDDKPDAETQTVLVSHRPVGRKLVGKLHEDTLFGPVPGDDTLYTGHKRVADLTPNHLRTRRPETSREAIERLAKRFFENGVEKDKRSAKRRAKEIVSSPGFVPKLVDPPPEKSGLVRDPELRRILREQIDQRLAQLEIDRDADSFTKSDMNKMLKEGPLRMPSGVPIKRVVLLRTMKDPVVMPRKRFDYESKRWVRDTGRAAGPLDDDERTRADRAYVGGNNHHIEVREDERGHWSGIIIPTFEAARRVRIQKRDAVDRSDDDSKGGRFIMSLAEGETVYMRHKETHKPGYFVVFKLDKPQKIQFKPHWDARRAKGEKDDNGNLIDGSMREEIPVSASQLRELAPPGELTPIKVDVDPLGRPRRIEPILPEEDLPQIDPRVMAIARDAIAARRDRKLITRGNNNSRQPGSWSWMRARLRAEKLAHLAPQLSQAMRLLKEM